MKIRKFIKIITVIWAVFFFCLTFSDVYIKNYGTTDIIYDEALANKIDKASSLYSKSPTDTRIMTYNILADSKGFEGTDARTRADGVIEIFKSFSPDIVGLQETNRKWFTLILKNTDYRFVSPVKSGALELMTTIIYNPDTVSLLDCGNKAFTFKSNFKLRRMVWGHFINRTTKETFIVINTHFNLCENNNAKAPLTQSKELIILANTLQKKHNCPVIIIGDFNSKERGETKSPYELLLTGFTDCRASAKSEINGNNTTEKSVFFDHIFSLGDVEVKSINFLSYYGLKALSDHYPIYVDITVNSPHPTTSFTNNKAQQNR
ncbi:MAG: endonuclease/exonuclease/phosphatase family protein [Acutalibacteraceae bacterium]